MLRLWYENYNVDKSINCVDIAGDVLCGESGIQVHNKEVKYNW